MRKSIILFTILTLIILQTSCKTITNIRYEEQDNNRISAVKEYMLRKHPLPSITKFTLAGQLIDEKGRAITNYSFSYSLSYYDSNSLSSGTITSNKDGFFSINVSTNAEIKYWGSLSSREPTIRYYGNKVDLIFAKGIDDSIKTSFMEGKRVIFTQPIKISYIFYEDYGLITKATFIERVENSGYYESLKEVERIFESNDDKIVLTKQEFYSSKNKNIEDREKAGYFDNKIMQIIQVLPNEGFLAHLDNDNNTVIYVLYKHTNDLYDDLWLRVNGKWAGTQSYQAVSGGMKTVPKVIANKVEQGTKENENYISPDLVGALEVLTEKQWIDSFQD
jgi:hypothetical protein